MACMARALGNLMCTPHNPLPGPTSLKDDPNACYPFTMVPVFVLCMATESTTRWPEIRAPRRSPTPGAGEDRAGAEGPPVVGART
mmetsp:Transcript_115992/g.370051  ORF Transcript_115992/g.370051 Transcript_115992/m.370051 type:complete len:85 (+) Transcript_115992:60-314(+)